MPRSRGRGALTAAALGAAVALTGTSASWAFTTQHGHVHAADRTLRPDCHLYRYHYVVKPGSGDWLFETHLYDPRGRARGTGDFAAGADPEDGHPAWGICRSTVVPGRFTIRATLRWYTPGALPTDPLVEHTAHFKPAHFRLHRR